MTNKAGAVLVNLGALCAANTAVMQVLHPVTNAPIGWEITFAGPGHPKAIAWSNEAAREALLRDAQIEAQRLNGREIKPESRDVDVARRNNTRWVVARIVDWTPVTLEEGGSAITFAEQTATEILLKPELNWLYAQCLEFLNAKASFIEASATA
ncbi:putative branched-chain amino acid ABC transporter [Bosea sp. LC85]|uniref:hypothetical protein n=1 Tax=Bosea sp. LC85 TaxID=1502851 RepID=UPI0004E3AA0C|nr:hypothetical protein [Bosea sp. LC85]KFC73195.1 putative branched-chain amino acid ABC transporter [Bosea sp. LC85]